ncbi:MAG: SMP-30/gluconolactonase/LRE family protein [Hyalangium sp.]|uniref:SMP-30/gluconolactonase/LRE family protein n=1 Tax=Hyalangium sp. TaxID=2028555 RepID=UPI00389A0E91
MNVEVEAVGGSDLLGEGPFWDVAGQRLLWSDVKSQTIHEYAPAAGRRGVVTSTVMAFSLVLNRDGALLTTGPFGLHYYRPGKEPVSLLREHQGEALFLNDVIADPRGRVYAGTVYYGANGLEKTGKLYLIDGQGPARVVDEGIQMSNGLGFSPDDRTLYYTDTLARVIYAYAVDPETGALSNKRVLARIPAEDGMPDGMTVDAEGFIWSAQWYGSQVIRFDPEGKVERRIKLPVRQVASVMFGGRDLDELYITTASDRFISTYAPPGYNHDDTSNVGGSLYRVRPGVRGRPEHLGNLRPTP